MVIIYPADDQINLHLGTLLADYLWLLAASLTDSLSVSLSLSLSIPLSFIADIFLRGQPPSLVQCFAAIPIVFSFIVSGFLDNPKTNNKVAVPIKPFKPRKQPEDDEQHLLDEITDNVWIKDGTNLGHIEKVNFMSFIHNFYISIAR